MGQDVTELLIQWSDGSETALEELTPLVYGELNRIARARFAREREGHTLQPTALTHEAFLRLCGQKRVRWRSRAHFYAIAAEMMRRILVEHARKRRARKRGGDAVQVVLDEARDGAVSSPELDLLDLHRALERLAAIDDRLGRVVELRYFGGLNVEETADVLSVSPATVKRDWDVARRWLHRELRG